MAKVGKFVENIDAIDNTGATPAAVPDREWHSSLGGWGNMLSHRKVLLGSRGVGNVVVFEDDAAVPNDFDDRLDRFITELELCDQQWEAIYLGGEHMRVPREVGPGVGRVRNTIRTHAYLFKVEAIEIALDVMATCTEHWDVPIAERLAARGHTYAPMPFIVGSLGLPGDITDSIPIGKYTP